VSAFVTILEQAMVQQIAAPEFMTDTTHA
jgi:hypothetical protein